MGVNGWNFIYVSLAWNKLINSTSVSAYVNPQLDLLSSAHRILMIQYNKAVVYYVHFVLYT